MYILIYASDIMLYVLLGFYFFHILFFQHYFYLYFAALDLLYSVQASHWGGFFYWGAQAQGVQTSVVATCGLGSCGAWT